MTNLEMDFTRNLLEQLSKAEETTGIPETRLKSQTEQQGGVKAMKNYLRRGQTTRQFEKLKQMGRLELSPEYLVTKGKYGPLFTDQEVDLCLQVLLDAGAF